jgi:hypothetical protein
MYTWQRPSLFMRDKSFLSSERILQGQWPRGSGKKKKSSGREPQEAQRQGALIGGKPPVANWLWLEPETVKYGRKSLETRTWEWLNWRGPTAIVNNKLILLPEAVPHQQTRNYLTVRRIWPRAPAGASKPKETGLLTICGNMDCDKVDNAVSRIGHCWEQLPNNSSESPANW